MDFTTALGEQLWYGRTPYVLGAYLIVTALSRHVRTGDRYHVRAAPTLLVGHVIAALVTAGLHANGYDPHLGQLVSLAFELLTVVALGMTAAFRLTLPRLGLNLPRIMVDLITAVAVLVVLIIVGKRAGFSVAGLITTSAVLTAVIGFSLQDTLGSVMGGLSLQLDKSVSVDDWITLGPGQPAGRVVEIRWRYTAIETRNWETVIIPNSYLVRNQVTILGRRFGEPVLLRRHIEFFVDFRTPPTEVIEAVTAALVEPVPNMAAHPAPQVIFFGVRDSFGVYEVRYWLSDLNVDDGTDSAVRVRVWFALRRAGIPMAIPAHTMFVTHETVERSARKANLELERRMAALESVDLFRGLPDELRRDLADQLTYMPFAAGEAVTREGAQDEGLYMLVEGEATVTIGAGRDERQVARLGPGQFFGEMALMTGATRTATVHAATDLVTYRISKPAFQRILKERPAIAEQIAEVLAQRRTALAAVRGERDDGQHARLETTKQHLLDKIRGFFGIDRAN